MRRQTTATIEPTTGTTPTPICGAMSLHYPRTLLYPRHQHTPYLIYTQIPHTQIHLACQRGAIEIIKLLCLACADLDIATDDGIAPIHIACQYGFVECVSLLEDHGCDLEAKTKKGENRSAQWFSAPT